MTEKNMALEDLGDLVLHSIISKLSGQNAAIFACVNKRFRVSASEDDLWRFFCLRDLDLSVPEDPSGNPTSSFKETYKLWKEAFGMYPWPLVQRVKQCWTTLKSWLVVNFPEAAYTLRKGASEAKIKKLEKTLGVKLPIPTRLLYRFCDGQEIPDASSENEYSPPLGLIGGYNFYSHAVNVYLLPLSLVTRERRDIISELGYSNRSRYIKVATSTYGAKSFFLNCANGELLVGTRNLDKYGEMLPCVPGAVLNSANDMNSCQQQDALLLWLEEHGRRLQSGVIGIREEGKTRSISLFPEVSPLCSTAVTNGVQIRASAVFVPELCDLQGDEGERYWFTYSIRMRLLSQGCMLDGLYFNSCQLLLRHWIICANEAVVSDVAGEAVIGQYPLLHPDGDEFVYQSCSSMPASPGSIEGTFTFIPGRLMNPKGRPFGVEVAQFPLQLPEYIF